MRRWRNVVPWLVAAFVFVPLAALAQETTGSIAGTVMDSKQKPVYLAKVTVAGPHGSQAVRTSDDGQFLISLLEPGSYKLTVAADGFAEVTDANVVVRLGQRTGVTYSLLGKMEETVKVVAKRPAIDTTSTTTGATIPTTIVEQLPIGRNIQNVVYLTPGVKSGGGTGNANPSIEGSSGFENEYVIDGLNVTNAGYGALGSFSNIYRSQGTGVTFSFVKETQVITNGFAPEYGQVTGGIVNLITKSGTNEWHGSLFGNYTPTGTQSRFKTPQLVNTPIAPYLGISKLDYGFDVGGPLKKDHVFIWLGGNPEKDDTERIAPVGYGLHAEGGKHLVKDTTNLAAKLTLVPKAGHTIDLSFFSDPSHTNFSFNRGSSSMRQDDEHRFTKLKTGYDNLVLNYTGAVNPHLLVEGTLGSAKDTFKELIPAIGNTHQDTDNTVLPRGDNGGVGFTEPDSVSKNLQVALKFTSILKNHELKYGIGEDQVTYNFITAYTGPPIMTPGGETDTGVTVLTRGDCRLIGDPNIRQYAFISDPGTLQADYCDPNTPMMVPVIYRVNRGYLTPPVRHTTSRFHYAFVQDNWSITKNLHLTYGLRYERESLRGTDIAYSFPYEVAPRIGISWDPTHDGKSKVYGYWGRFFERVPSDIAVRSLSQEVDVGRSDYYDQALTIPIPNGAGGGTRYFPLGDSTTNIEAGTRVSYTDGMLAGYQRSVKHDWTLSVEWHYRKLGRVVEDYSNIPASDIELGTNTFGGYLIGNQPPQTPLDLSGGGVAAVSYAKPKRDYQALVFQATHQTEHWYANVQYTLSSLHGNYEGLYRNDNDQSDPNITSLFDFPNEAYMWYTYQNGALNTNRTHKLQALGSRSWTNGWAVGSRFNLQTGTPKNKLATLDPYSTQGEIPLVPRGSLGDTPPEYTFDFQVSKQWKVKGKTDSKMQVSLDVFNILDRQYPTAYDWNWDLDSSPVVCTIDPSSSNCANAQQQYQRLVESVAQGTPNPDYGKPTSYSAPRELRFGWKWTF